MILPLLLVAAPTSVAAPTLDERYQTCVTQARADPAAAEATAARWRVEGGGYWARQCEGIAFANEQRWPAAAGAFEDAARAAEIAHDSRASAYWAQGGNAWLAAGDTARARAALDAALASGSLDGLALGEAHLDRARALVAGGDLKGGRVDLDAALVTAADDPLAWLLSATLARRTGDGTRASHDIAQALRLSPDDAEVELERGNIAAARGDGAGARDGWREAMKVQPGSAAANRAAAALQQFEAK